MATTATRTRRDRCPGALRPWPADDGLLVRLRLIGGQLSGASLSALASAAQVYGDGRVYVTGRANLQVRALPGAGEQLSPPALAAIQATGLLPVPSHELARNVMFSPQTGLAGGRVDLRPLAAELDERICADPVLADLPGRFLFVLDDGRGDVLARSCDLGLVALDATTGQLRVGSGYGAVLPLADAAAELVALARRFCHVRGAGPEAAWHVDELPEPLVRAEPADPRLPTASQPLPFGSVPGGRHVPVPEEGLDQAAVAELVADTERLVVTPWRGVLIPEQN